eukprot:scaffold5136_cov229-Pinguiococcus_pyrenoidosus.AAC.1
MQVSRLATEILNRLTPRPVDAPTMAARPRNRNSEPNRVETVANSVSSRGPSGVSTGLTSSRCASRRPGAATRLLKAPERPQAIHKPT